MWIRAPEQEWRAFLRHTVFIFICQRPTRMSLSPARVFVAGNIVILDTPLWGLGAIPLAGPDVICPLHINQPALAFGRYDASAGCTLTGLGAAMAGVVAMRQEKPSILVVDDDATNVMVLESMLKKEGYLTYHAHDGGEAFEAAKAQQPDLILLDLGLPDGSGLDLLRMIRTVPELHSTPVVVLSCSDSDPSR